MDELRPGDPSPIYLPVRYSSWEDLATKWGRGIRDLSPSRSTWEYRVRNDILFRKRPQDVGENGTPVGMASVSRGENGLRYFFYRMSNWRMRMSDRAELSFYGGIPVMDVEMTEMLKGLDLMPRAGYHEREALDFVRKWVEQKGRVANGERADWCGNIVQADEAKLLVGYMSKSRSAAATVDVARFDHEQGVLFLKGQAGRNQAVTWIRDALYSAIALASGAGLLPGYKVVSTNFLTGRADVVIRIKPVGRGILDPEGIEHNSRRIPVT